LGLIPSVFLKYDVNSVNKAIVCAFKIEWSQCVQFSRLIDSFELLVSLKRVTEKATKFSIHVYFFRIKCIDFVQFFPYDVNIFCQKLPTEKKTFVFPPLFFPRFFYFFKWNDFFSYE
jgi:hypothetical protein